MINSFLKNFFYNLLENIKNKRIKKNLRRNKKEQFICYRIVDCLKPDHYILQLINTNVTFPIYIENLVLETNLLYRLHPIQACFIGIEYSKIFHSQKLILDNKANAQMCRYGRYEIIFQDRKGNVYFIHKEKNFEYYLRAEDIALNPQLIDDFDSSQAFFIGFLAGLSLNKHKKPIKIFNKKKIYSHLHLVK